MTHAVTSTTNKILTTGDQEYWVEVKRKTRFRNAHGALDQEISKIRPSMIYEQYVNDLMEAVRCAANIGRLTEDSEYGEFKIECASKLGISELLEDESVIADYATTAISEAQEALYGLPF